MNQRPGRDGKIDSWVIRLSKSSSLLKGFIHDLSSDYPKLLVELLDGYADEKAWFFFDGNLYLTYGITIESMEGLLNHNDMSDQVLWDMYNGIESSDREDKEAIIKALTEFDRVPKLLKSVEEGHNKSQQMQLEREKQYKNETKAQISSMIEDYQSNGAIMTNLPAYFLEY